MNFSFVLFFNKFASYTYMKRKITLSLLSIAAILLISSVISIIEYSSMSTYVSSLIADNISSVNAARKLSDDTNRYNLEILAVIGETNPESIPQFDSEFFVSTCDSLRSSVKAIAPLADSVVYSYSAYMLTSLELKNVLESNFIDSRTWYFERLQPRFNRLRSDIDKLSSAIYDDLEKNSTNFDSGFYRSIIPGIVAVGVGLVLILLLLFYVMVYYVNPIYRMLSGLNNYKSFNKKYNYDFDGDDQLKELNTGISEIIGENQEMRHRISVLKGKTGNESK